MSTDVSGVISGILGSLVKVGTGTLTLSGNANLGGTTIDGGTLAVNGGTLNASNTIVLGSTAGSSGTLNIGAGGGASTQNLIVGQSGVGTLAVQNGGTLTDFGGFVGNLPGSQGTATVSGAGSTWTNTDTIQVGGLGTGTLTIENGGTVNSGGGGSIGLSAGSTGTVTVTGPGSTWNNSPGGGLNIGSFGTGTLTIANGGMVINNTAFAANIGNGAGSQGTVTVTGAGSTWSNSSGVNIGNWARARSRLRTAALSRAGPIVIATNAGAIGTLNIGAGAGNPAAAPGTLTAPRRRIWRWHRHAQLQSHVRRLRVCARDQRQRHCQCARGHHHANSRQQLQRRHHDRGPARCNSAMAGTRAASRHSRPDSAASMQSGRRRWTTRRARQPNAVILNPSANLIMGGSNSLTLTGVISGAGALTKNGSSPLILTNDNSYGGAGTIRLGDLQLGNGGATGQIREHRRQGGGQQDARR